MGEEGKFVPFPEKGYLEYFSPEQFEFLLKELLKRGERSFFDFKREEIKPKDLADCIGAMANSDSGLIVLGVDQKSTENVWKGVSDVDKWINNFSNLKKDTFADILGFRWATFQMPNTENPLMLIFVPLVEEPILTNGLYRFRVDASTIYAKTEDEKIKKQKMKEEKDLGFTVFQKLKVFLILCQEESNNLEDFRNLSRITNPSPRMLDKIFFQYGQSKISIERFEELFIESDHQQKELLKQYFKDKSNQDKFLELDWSELLDSEYSPELLADLVEGIKSINSQLSLALCDWIFTHFSHDFPDNFASNEKILSSLNFLADIHPELQEKLDELSWGSARILRISTLQSLLQRINENITNTVKAYKEGKEAYQTNSQEEKKLVTRSLVHAFYQKLVTNTVWEDLPYAEHSITEMIEFLSHFGGYLPFPEKILDFSWSDHLRETWRTDPETTFLIFFRSSHFSSRYFKKWPNENEFPEFEDFVRIERLDLLNVFIQAILEQPYWLSPGKLHDFFHPETFALEKLIPLIANEYWPAFHDIQALLKKHYLEKSELLPSLFNQQSEKTRFLNRYDQALATVFQENFSRPNIESKCFNENYSWFWSFFSLPSLIDVLFAIEMPKSKASPSELVNTVQKFPEIWNDLLNFEFYIASLEDTYPGSRENNFLRRDLITTFDFDREPGLKELELLQQAIKWKIYMVLSRNNAYHELLVCLLKETTLLDDLFHETILQLQKQRSLQFDETYHHTVQLRYSRDYLPKEEHPNFLNFSFYFDHIDIYLMLLETQFSYSLLEQIWVRLLKAKIIDHTSSPLYSLDRHKIPIKSVIRKKLLAETEELSKWEEKWEQLFRIDVSITDNTIRGIPIKLLMELSYRQDYTGIFEDVPWDTHLRFASNKELESFSKLFEKGFFFDENTQAFDSFVVGIIEIFPQWFYICLKKYDNRLVSLDDMLWFTSTIKNKELQNQWLGILITKMEAEDWSQLLHINLDIEERRNLSLENIVKLLKNLWSYPRGHPLGEKILAILSSSPKLFSQYFRTFWDLIYLANGLEEIRVDHSERLDPLLEDFYKTAEKMTYNFPSDPYSTPWIYCLNFLNGKLVLQRSEMQGILEAQDFFPKLKQYLISITKERTELLEDLHRRFLDFKTLDSQNLVDGKKFVQEVLDDFPFAKYLFSEKTHWRSRIPTEAHWNEEYLEIFVQSKSFQSFDWSSLFDVEDYRSCDFFLAELLRKHDIVISAVISNPSFWILPWRPWLKDMLLYGNKKVYDFFSLLRKYVHQPLVREFLRSSNFEDLPWRNCKKKIEIEKSSNMLTLDQFKEILEFLSSYKQIFSQLITEFDYKEREA